MQDSLCQCQNQDEHTAQVTINMPVELLEQLRQAAAIAGSDYQSLLICYVQKGLLDSEPTLKRKKFVENVRAALEEHGVEANIMDKIFTKILY